MSHGYSLQGAHQSSTLCDHIWRKYGVMLAGSWGPLEAELMRIGHMGVQASLDYLLSATAARGLGLRDMGHEVNVERALDAVLEAFR